jgi:hypothetical protein
LRKTSGQVLKILDDFKACFPLAGIPPVKYQEDYLAFLLTGAGLL